MRFAPNSRVGPYEILATVGAGGMGEVYRAIDQRLGRIVALKVLPAAVSSDEERLRRFDIEARAIAGLSHPNILSIFDIGREGDIVYAVLEYVEGLTLKDVIATGPVPARKTADYARQIASGLAAAHAQGVVHRDLKPDNIMVTADGQIKLLDFGLARRSESSGGATTSIAGLTDPGKVLGTIGYMAPEQVRGASLDGRADIFAVGVVLYEMLAGQPPFARADRADALAAVLRDDPPALPPSVPGALQRIVQRCLEKSPAERYQSAADLAFSLDAFGGSSGSGAIVAADGLPPGRARRWWPLAIAALVVAALAGGWFASKILGQAASVTFSRVTYRRGTVLHARFAPGAKSVVYDAAWSGRPFDIFETALGSHDARPRGLEPAALLAVSPSGELAIAQAAVIPTRLMLFGRLALATASGLPRPLVDQVSSADWTPDGRELVVARKEGTEWRIEWPQGTVIHRSEHPVLDLRVSPAGNSVAWMERTATLTTAVMVADRGGAARMLAQAGAAPGGLAWSADAREVWFTSAKSANLADLELRATTLSGSSRSILDLPGGIRLLDIASDGRVLLSLQREGSELFVEQDGKLRPSGWLSSSVLKAMSADGSQVLFSEDGPSGFDLFLRPTSGGRAVTLATGLPWDRAQLSPDATAVAIRDKDVVRVIPVGAGDRVTLSAPGQVATWLPDKRLLLWSRESRDSRPAIVSIDAKSPEQILKIQCADLPVALQGGAQIACVGADGAVLIQAAGETRRVVPSARVGQLIGGSADGKQLFWFTPGALPQAVLGLDLANGRVSVVREVTVLDPTGVWRVGPIAMSLDRRVLAYSLLRQLDELYVYTGLR